MKKLLAAFLMFFLFRGYGYSNDKEGIFAEINTSKGLMIFELYYKKAPVTVANFIGLAEGTKEFTDVKTREKAKRPFYNGRIFHRVIKGFMIQGGCPYGNGMGGPGYSFVDEFNADLKHDSAGVLSMANSGPNTNGSQFFVTLAPAPHLDGKHTVFGKLVEGKNVLEKIGEIKTDDRDKPLTNVTIESVVIKRIGEDAKAFNVEKAFAENDRKQRELQQESERKQKAFFKQLNMEESGIITSDSGLKYYVKKAGSGSTPNPGDTITAHYTGYLLDGTKFDSSYDRNAPFKTQIGIGRVIRGWDEAFLGMKKGEKRILIIPSELAYGKSGVGLIPADATLIFDVELLDITK